MESIVPAMSGNRVQGGILSYPATGRAKQLGYRELLDISALNMPYASTGIATRGEVIRKEPDLVRKYMSAQVEAIARMKRDRPVYDRRYEQVLAHQRSRTTLGSL